MKKTLLCLLLALCLCLSCIMLIACDKEDETPADDPATDVAPGDEEVGKKGEITLFPKEENEVSPNQPNEQLGDSTTRY